MRRRRTDQERAEELLQEWAHGVEAALGYGFPPAPTPGRVQNGESTYSSPEQYAHYQHRHERLDRAVRRVGHIDPSLRRILWQCHVSGPWRADGRPDTRRMAEEMGVAERTWRRWRSRALRLYLQEFQALDNTVATR